MNEPTAHNDKIYIRDLSVRCIIGVNDDERIEKQDIIIKRPGHRNTWSR